MKVIIIVLILLLIICPILTFAITRKISKDSTIIYTIDGLSSNTGPTPNTSSQQILNNTSRSNTLSDYTSVGNGTQVVTLDSDLFLLDGGINIDSLYINNPDGYFIRSASQCGF